MVNDVGLVHFKVRLRVPHGQSTGKTYAVSCEVRAGLSVERKVYTLSLRGLSGDWLVRGSVGKLMVAI